MTNCWSVSARLLMAAVVVTVVSLSSNASAQNRYQSWQDPAKQAEASTQGLIKELKALIDEAERSRAANPIFLRDLRDLARKYDDPWPNQLLSDNFSDGNFTANPKWLVTEGKFRIESGFGLRGSFTDGSTSQSEQRSNRSQQDAAAQLFGAILNQALGGSSGSSQQSTNRSSSGSSGAERRAAIHVPAAISNAFSIELELSSWRNERGNLAVQSYQGSDRRAGYRLVYRSGSLPSLALFRYSPRGIFEIARSQDRTVLEDKKSHLIKWTRDLSGRMSVTVDDRDIIQADDLGFRDPFDGLELINTEGDYIVSRVRVSGK